MTKTSNYPGHRLGFADVSKTNLKMTDMNDKGVFGFLPEGMRKGIYKKHFDNIDDMIKGFEEDAKDTKCPNCKSLWDFTTCGECGFCVRCADCGEKVVNPDDKLCHKCYHKSIGKGECHCDSDSDSDDSGESTCDCGNCECFTTQKDKGAFHIP